MQVSVEATEGLERRMTVAVPSERIETGVDSRLREAAKTVRLNGFRQGKVPFNVVKKRFGKGVRGEVIGSSGTTTGIEVIELIDSKSMTAAMETANKVVSTYQAPNK